MEKTTLEFIYFAVAVISVIYVICFFVLCANVAKLVKQANNTLSDYNEYLVFEKMGDVQKAYYHLHRAFALRQISGITDAEIDDYYKKFKALGIVPDSKYFEKPEEVDEIE